jgi:hypothetical protein
VARQNRPVPVNNRRSDKFHLAILRPRNLPAGRLFSRAPVFMIAMISSRHFALIVFGRT